MAPAIVFDVPAAPDLAAAGAGFTALFTGAVFAAALPGAADLDAIGDFDGATAARFGAGAADACDFLAAAFLGRAAGAGFGLRVDGIAASY